MRIPTPEPCAPLAPASALRTMRQRLNLSRRRSLLFVAAVCLGIAVVLTAMYGGGLAAKCVYSFSIGFSCLALTDATRLFTAWLSDRVRAWRGQAPPDPASLSNWMGVLPAMVVAVLLAAPLGHWLADWVLGNQPGSLWKWTQWGRNDVQITLAFAVVGTLLSVFAISTLERLAGARAQAEAAQRLAAENQLRLLQSQLEPHMLFNTLANLRVLIGLNPPQAQAMLDRLIAFLRATLNASRNSAHPLSSEFAHLSDYLALMAMRMGPRLAVQLDLPDALASQPVPPLLLQPLVENAIKHGLEPKVEGGRIEVSARCEGQALHLTVRDTGVGLNAAPAAGGSHFGLEQVRARLATLYGSRARFQLQAADDGRGGVLATLEIPMAA